jgi:large subunit ribosomal protein L25
MRKDITITAELRASRGKNEARRLRVRGFSPAVLYGVGGDPVAISVDPKQVTKILHSGTGHNTIFDVAVSGGETSPVMFVDWQLDPVTGNLLHADLKRIDLTRRLQVSVPVRTFGEARGVKIDGGLLETVGRAIEIECLPDEIPEHFDIDVSDVGMGQSRRASDVALTGSMKLVSPADSVIAHVVALRAEEEVKPAEAEVAAVEGATPAEPEVIKKGKKEEEGAEAEVKEKGKEKDKEKEKGKKK